LLGAAARHQPETRPARRQLTDSPTSAGNLREGEGPKPRRAGLVSGWCRAAVETRFFNPLNWAAPAPPRPGKNFFCNARFVVSENENHNRLRKPSRNRKSKIENPKSKTAADILRVI
jgi:hypothetical protein